MMKYRKLGKTNLNVSVISVGCSGYWGQRRFPEALAHEIVIEAVERGVNYFDTGHNYSGFNAEPRLGRVLRDILKNTDRSKLVISTKAGTISPSANILPGQKTAQKDFSPVSIETSCLKSIDNLQCDYLDIFHLHGITRVEVTDDLIQRLSSMKKRGLFRYLGINTHSQAEMEFVAQFPEIFDVILIDYNVLQQDREPAIEKLHKAGIGVVAGTVLAQGHLVAGKIGSIHTPADLWYLARALLKKSSRRLARNSHAMRDALSSIEGMTPAQAAIAYVLGNPYVASCTVGTTKIPNLLEILSAVDKTIPEHGLTAIKGIFANMPGKVSQ